MKLAPFPVHCLRLCEPLPFDLLDAQGQVRLATGDTVDYPVQFDALTRVPLLAQEGELTAWLRTRLAPIELAPAPPALSQQWRDLVDLLDDALHGLSARCDVV